MAVNPDKTVRKNVSLPLEVMDRVTAYQADKKLNSESEALRSLIEVGLLATESPENLVERCKRYLADGRSISWIFGKIVDENPRVSSASLDAKEMFIMLGTDDFIKYYRDTGVWEVV